MRLSNIIIVVFILVIAFLIFKTTSKPEKIVTSHVAAKTVKNIPQKRVPTRKINHVKKNKFNKIEQNLNLERVPVKTDMLRTEVPLKVNFLSRCTPSDINAIMMDLKYSTVKRVIMTMEPISVSPDGPVAMREIFEDELGGDGFSHTFELPAIKEPAQYGIFICKDSSGTGRCNGKEVMDINQVFNQYLSIKRGKNGFKIPRDKTYFFQYVIIDPETMTGFTDYPKEITHFTRLKEYANKRGISGEGEVNKIDLAGNVIKTLRSLKSNVVDGTYEVVIPRGDPGPCRGANPFSRPKR